LCRKAYGFKSRLPHTSPIIYREKKDEALKIETQPRDDHQVTLTVEIEAEQMEGAKHRAARKISERKSIPGFRPGKAPYVVVVRSFGEAAISEEAVDLLLEEVYPKALELRQDHWKRSKTWIRSPGLLLLFL
jgi:hypothetical protein